MSILVLLALALSPGVSIAIYIYLKDSHEPEPPLLLAKSFLFGMLSVVIVLLVSIPIEIFVPIKEEDLSQQAIHAFILVALVEEASKFLFLRGVLYPNPNFNEPFDGIVYSVMVAMGFATLENLAYVLDGGLGTAVLRMFSAVPAHATFAILMGYYVGKAKFEHKRLSYSLYGLLAAVLFHGAYDYFIFINFIPGMGLGAVLSLAVGGFLSLKAIKIHREASRLYHPQTTENSSASEGAGKPTEGPGPS